MHRRIVVAVSAVLFALLSVVVTIVSDMHDRTYPQELRARSVVTLDFGNSNLSDDEAFRQLGVLSDELGIGLVKLAPDLGGDQTGQVFVALGEQADLPEVIRRFGNEPDAQIRDSAALRYSYASGQYLITGTTDRLAEFKAWLKTQRVGNTWRDDTLSSTLTLLVRQGSFATSLLAAVALVISLVLYWLSVKAKGRALRVLAGTSTWRIQYEDLVGFLGALSVAAVLCGVVAISYVGSVHGWIFVPYYARALVLVFAVVVAAAVAGAMLMSATSWPSAAMLATRKPAVMSLRMTSTLLKLATFALVLAAVSPAFTAYLDSRETAAQQARWKALADQVALAFPATGESGFQQLMPQIGEVVREAEAKGSVAMSYTWTDDMVSGYSLGAYRHLTLVNQRWLDLMLGAGRSGAAGGAAALGLAPISMSEVPEGARQFLSPNFEIWSRYHVSPEEALAKLSFFRYAGPPAIPLSLGGSGDLVFPNEAIVIVAPSLYDTFNDSFLASVSSSRNLVFTGLGPTQALLARNGLLNRVYVRYVAEEGVLRAQLTAYFAWLRGVSLVAMTVALVVSALISAFIAAVLKARRDFPLRLAGMPWSEILADRVVKEWAVGVVVAVLVIFLRGPSAGPVVAVVAAAALLVSPLTHVLAARWAFKNVSLRRL